MNWFDILLYSGAALTGLFFVVCGILAIWFHRRPKCYRCGGTQHLVALGVERKLCGNCSFELLARMMREFS